MKKHNFLFTSLKVSFAFLLAFNLSSCDKCKNTECVTPAEPFYFQLIDKETNQNLLQNGTYKLSDIRIKSVSENTFYAIEIDSIGIEGQKQIVLVNYDIGWKSSNNKNYTLVMKDSLNYEFIYSTVKETRHCCTFYIVEQVSSPQIEITKTNSNKGILYKLVL